MRILWEQQQYSNSMLNSSFDSFRKLLQASNPVDTEPFQADWKDAVGITIAFVVSGLANSVGIGGGLFWVPLFNALLGFSVRASASMSQALVACGTIGGTMYSILLRHPTEYTKPLITYSLAALLMPALVLGVSIGVLLNIITPPLITSIVLFLILVLVASRTLQKGIQQKKQEKADAVKNASREDDAASENRSLKRSSTSFREWAGVLHRPILEWPYIWELLITGGILLGFQVGKSQFQRCTWQYAVLFGVEVSLVAAFTIISVFLHYKKNKKQTAPEESASNGNAGKHENQGTASFASTSTTAGGAADTENENPYIEPTTVDTDNNKNNGTIEDTSTDTGTLGNKKVDRSDWPLRRLLYIYVIVIVIGMIAGMVGLGGGVLIAPLMMELGVHPQSAAATSTLVVVFSSTIATVTFGLYGRINLSYFAVYGPVCFVGGLVGVFVLSGLVRRYNMASLITLMLAGLVVVSAGLVAGFALREAVQGVVESGEIVAAAPFCSS